MKFSRILVANRGEIAVRILRGARAAGYQTVAVYSEADRSARHVREADRAVFLGGAAAAQSYLSIPRLLDAAAKAGADAVHPGYGFLSERAEFARAVRAAGLIFIGPSAEAIDAMGDKSAAKVRMIAAGVPCLPGFHGRTEAEQTDERLAGEARAIGFPVMIKAAAGGGGRGMRLVHEEAALPESLRAARSEAQSAFGDGTLLIERALVGARHVEIQVFGDRQGRLLHFGERDCTVQRRNQKVVEESPSPAVDAELRATMGAAAVRAAQSIAYEGAGTVEFMLDSSGRFFFLEMNTRLQVEHPVTELTYDVDLVELQFRIAAGEPLPFTQAEVDARRHGHAIEVRLCAEDADYRPQTGTVLRYHAPAGVRVDACLEDGTVVSPFYDSMLGKIIAHGPDRESARRRLLSALAHTSVLGLETNRDRLVHIVASDLFASGQFGTDFLQHLAPAAPAPPWHAALAAVVLELDDARRLRERHGFSASLLGFQSCELAPTPYLLDVGDAHRTLRVSRTEHGFDVDGAHLGAARLLDAERVWYAQDGSEATARFVRSGDTLWLDAGGLVRRYVDLTHAPVVGAAEVSSGAVRARIEGKTVRVLVAIGDVVAAGQTLVVLESMKMELELVAPHAGTVRALHVRVGDQVHAERVLVEVKPHS